MVPCGSSIGIRTAETEVTVTPPGQSSREALRHPFGSQRSGKFANGASGVA